MSRYSTVAIALHWIIAVAMIAMLAMGLWMTGALKDPAQRALAFEVIQLHKSVGLSILVLTLVRLAWRLGHRPPLLPATMKAWEKAAARLTHFAFYVLLLALPLTGWAMVSTSPFGLPTFWFGLFEWPHITALAQAANASALHDGLEEAHELLAFGAIGFIVLHVAAALKHHWIDRDDVLARMLPWTRRSAGRA